MRLAPLFLAAVSAVAPQSLSPQSTGSPGSEPQSHESFYYNVEWRLINAGRVKLDFRRMGDQGAQANVRVESAGMVSTLYKVEDNYSVNLNPTLCAESVQMTSREGSRQRETKISFDPTAHRASYLERDRVKNTTLLQHEIEIPACVHDVLGGLMYLRTLNLEPGQSTFVAVTDGKKSVMAKVEAQSHEDIKTPEGVYHTTCYEAYLFDNVLYKRPAHLQVWISDDKRRIPVQVRVRLQFTIGTITLQLQKHE